MVGRRDERAISEATSVAILVGLTLLVTASVGMGVLFLDDGDSGGPDASFSFDHRSGSSLVIVTFEDGDEIPAGELVVEGGTNSVTWAAVANQSLDQTVGPGDLVQLSTGSAWGESVTRGQTIEIYHDPGDGNRTLLDSWSAG